MRASLLLLIGFLGLALQAQASSELDNKKDSNAYTEGETLTYIMKYGPIKGGLATLTLKSTEINNKRAYHAKARARSIGITDKLYKIDDIYESVFDPESGLPYKAVRNISEGGYKYYNEVTFFHADSILQSQRSGEVEVPANIMDMVSSLYFIRNLDLESYKAGEVIELTTYFGDEIFHFPLRYRGKEKIKTRMGKIKCYRFDPVVEVGRVFESEDDMTVWITADENKIPILVRFDMIVGSVKCELKEYNNLLRPLALE